MTPDEIRVALETAVGVPEQALRAAVRQPAALAPAVIAVMQGMADGRLPLPREANLLRFGLRALAAARETSVCPAFLSAAAATDDGGDVAVRRRPRHATSHNFCSACTMATMRPCAR